MIFPDWILGLKNLDKRPKTGELVRVKPKRLPSFKMGKELKDRVNSEGLTPIALPRVASFPSNESRSARREARL
jgi:hypothetical protein